MRNTLKNTLKLARKTAGKMGNKINPFEAHPDISKVEKKVNNILTLEQVSDTIKNRIMEIRAAKEPRWGYGRHAICNLLASLLMEIEDKCQHN